MRTNSSARILTTLIFGISYAASAPAANTWQLTYELPGVQNSSATFFSNGIENFESRNLGTGQTFSSTFGGSTFTGTYSGVQIDSANQFGGAGGTGRFATISLSSYTLTLSAPVNYFGYWLSSLDPGNVVTFYDGATVVGQFNANTVFGPSVTSNSAYFGNPNPAFRGLDSSEAFAFVNFYATGAGDKFDRIVFTETTTGGYETDNQTVGIYRTIGGIPVIPEPSSAVLLLAGLLTIGLLSRSRSTHQK